MFGLEHLSNCHGEVSMIVAFLTSLPFIGVGIKARLARKHKEQHRFDHLRM